MNRNLTAFLFGSVAVAGIGTPATAELKYDNDSGGYVKLYGQFSPTYQSVDDGVETKNTIVDNAHSNSRVGLWVNQPFAAGTFTFNFETALGFRQSDGVSQTSTPDAFDWQKTSLRKVDFAFQGDGWGKVFVGQGSMATDGVAQYDLGSNGMTTYNGISDFTGSFQFRTAAGALSVITIGSALPSLDGGRRGRVRYDTPDFNGFFVSVAAGTEILADGNDDDFYDIALKYSGDINGTEVIGGIGFSRRDSNGVETDDTIGSLAVKFQSGLNLAFAAGSRDNDGSYQYVKAGYEIDLIPMGETAFAIDYYDGSDFGLPGRDSGSLGVGVNQDIDSANAQIYLGYRTHELSDPGVAYRDVDAYLFGARWKF
ncbi:MAG: porin [Pseudomonadota bacterium]